jgi:hypothetical protein
MVLELDFFRPRLFDMLCTEYLSVDHSVEKLQCGSEVDRWQVG